jgi:hypothetical protein
MHINEPTGEILILLYSWLLIADKAANFNRAGVPSVIMSSEMEDKIGMTKVCATNIYMNVT